MKKPENQYTKLLTALALALFINYNYSQNCEPYLGQTPPVNEAFLFPPDELQANNSWFWNGTPAFSPDGMEMFWVKYVRSINKTQIWFTKCEDGIWTEPQQAPFSQATTSDNNPKFTSSNDTLYFQSERPYSKIYRVTRVEGIWSAPVAMNLYIPAGLCLGKQFSISKNKTIYAELENAIGTNCEIYKWAINNGQYSTAQKVTELCSPYFDGFPTIDWNERFITFTSDREEGTDNFDIFISFKNKDNSWSTPENLSLGANIPNGFGWTSFSPDGQYMFYTKSDSMGFNPYWINTRFMDAYNPNLPYLGQTPPGNSPIRFGPASILSNSTGWWRTSPVFSPDGRELLFAKYLSNLPAGNHKLYCMRIDSGAWTMPEPPTFVSDSDDYSPVFSKNGDTVYFSSTRDGSQKIYITTRLINGWSEPQMLNFPYQCGNGAFSWDLSLAQNGTIYFSVWENNQTEIYKSVPVNGQYVQYEKLPEEINSTSQDNSAYIEPNESYIIFASNRPGGFGYHDLYIAFKNGDGSWTLAQNMGSPINNIHEDASPRVTPDGKYLFFTSLRSGDYGYNPYWIDAEVIEQFNPFNKIEKKQKKSEIAYIILNPANNRVTIWYYLNESADLTVFNSNGYPILQKKINNGCDEIDIQSFPAGLYILKVSNANNSIQKTIIKL